MSKDIRIDKGTPKFSLSPEPRVISPRPKTLGEEDRMSMLDLRQTLGSHRSSSVLSLRKLHKIIIGVDFGTTYTGTLYDWMTELHCVADL